MHLPGTISRRVRTQSVRTVPDRHLRRFMESTGVRLPRWFTAAGQIFDEQREIEEQDEDESVSRRLRDRTASLVGSHPVFVASFLGRIGGRGRVQAVARAGAAARRRAGGVPGFVARVLRRAGVRLPDDRARRDAGGEPLARSDGRALVALVREHGDRTEGVAGGGADPGVRHAVSSARAPHRPSGRGRPGRRLLRTVGHGAVELLGRPHRAPGGAVRLARPLRATGGRRSDEGNCPTGGGGSSPASR